MYHSSYISIYNTLIHEKLLYFSTDILMLHTKIVLHLFILPSTVVFTCFTLISLHSVLNSISLDDTSQFSGDSPAPSTEARDLVLHDIQTQVQRGQKKEKLLEKKGDNTINKNRRRKKIKSHKQRRKQGHSSNQIEDEEKRRAEEEKRREYEKEELRIEKELKREEEKEKQENENNEESEEEEEDILRGDVFRMPPRFPIPEPSVEIPPLPTGCSILDNTVSCINAKLTRIPPIMDKDLTSLELVGKERLATYLKYFLAVLHSDSK